MTISILFETEAQENAPRSRTRPAYFDDLNISPMEEAVLAKEPSLQDVFRTPLREASCIRFRQDVMRDLDDAALCKRLGEEADAVRRIHRALCAAQDNLDGGDETPWVWRSRVLFLACDYREAVEALLQERPHVHAPGLLRFFDALETYRSQPAFETLCREAQRLKEAFSALRLSIQMKAGKIRMRPDEGEEPVSCEMEALFARFAQDEAETLRHPEPTGGTMRHIDEAVLELVRHGNKPLFETLKGFAEEHGDFVEPKLLQFCREIQFYLGWQSYTAPLRALGLPFCFPDISETKGPRCEENFDIVLAQNLRRAGKCVVTNGFELNDPERVLVVTGPNQGGKTTFARAFGQFFHLAAIGCSVPGRCASIRPFDAIYTHFNREENTAAHSGQLQDDLLRLRAITQKMTADSILIINEIFASTTLLDALALGRKMMEEITAKGCTAVCVTFLDELAAFDAHTVSMMSTVDEDDPSVRTFKLVRRAADGLAYADYIAKKYDVTYEALTRRLGDERLSDGGSGEL